MAGWEALTANEYPDPLPLGCVTVPTATDPTQAPAGMDTFWAWSGLVPIFPNEPWDQARDRVAQGVVEDCADYFDNLKDLEIGRSVLGGPELEARFNAPHGNVYHVDPLLFRFGPLRPAMGFGSYKTPVPGLFLSGAGTHPTGGLCGLPGKLAAAEVAARGPRWRLPDPAARPARARPARDGAARCRSGVRRGRRRRRTGGGPGPAAGRHPLAGWWVGSLG